ncbi:hypothetical protein NZNM25_07940 [Nitrosopumilus zosterae]|uniref:Uncharacterized protein n=1 Tax=Nitrosopumilus zosterae TaxID=718286 RepID=A0A2S2KQR6_9ARCH|nr:hypothetical protein [Nitrosopumilus zosterae]BDQ30565.1 hypothetical protein NZOSNM25_000670 [Nitrosopumilus zosterae]GBH34003.1 hypothetical protein NZNM25_07940 [Nitrosopumilus zosterae]
MRTLRTQLSALTVILFTLGFVPYLTSYAFAAEPEFSSFVADDPDDLDAILSNGDTLTITFSEATNATNNGAMTRAEIIANFTDGTGGVDWGDAYSGVWNGDSTVLTVTLTDVTNAILTLGATTIEGRSTTNISSAAEGTNAELLDATSVTATLSGDFGLFVAVSASNGSGCSGDCEEPTLGLDSKGERLVDNGFTYNGKPIDVERYFTPYPLVTVNTGEKNIAEFKIYDNGGPDNISHFEIAFGLAKGEIMSESRAVINWDKSFDGEKTLSVNDPEHVLGDIEVSTSEGNCSEESAQQCLLVKVIHTFRAPLDFNILGTNVWDTKRNAWQNYYNHGIEVVGPSMNPAKEYDGINKGQIYHLTETGKTTAVDEFGNSWSLVIDQWTMDYVPNKKIIDEISMAGIAREHAYFNMYKYGQYLLAEHELNQICPECLDDSYVEIDNIFAYDFQERVNKLDKPVVKQKLLLGSEMAQKTMNHILDPISHLRN